MTGSLRVTTVLVVVCLVGLSCGSGRDGMIGERKVKYFTRRATFDRAEAMCITLGMQLLVINNEEENQEACTAIKSEPDAWIGGRNIKGGPFYWTGPSEKITFFKLVSIPRDPLDSFCLLLWPCRSGRPRWGDWIQWQCDALAPYICQETEQEWMKRTRVTTERSIFTSTNSEATTMTVIYPEDDAGDVEAWLNGLLWFFMVVMLVTVMTVYGCGICRNKRQSPVTVYKVENTTVVVFLRPK